MQFGRMVQIQAKCIYEWNMQGVLTNTHIQPSFTKISMQTPRLLVKWIIHVASTKSMHGSIRVNPRAYHTMTHCVFSRPPVIHNPLNAAGTHSDYPVRIGNMCVFECFGAVLAIYLANLHHGNSDLTTCSDGCLNENGKLVITIDLGKVIIQYSYITITMHIHW